MQSLRPSIRNLRQQRDAGAHILAALVVVSRGGEQIVRPAIAQIVAELVKLLRRDADERGLGADLVARHQPVETDRTSCPRRPSPSPRAPAAAIPRRTPPPLGPSLGRVNSAARGNRMRPASIVGGAPMRALCTASANTRSSVAFSGIGGAVGPVHRQRRRDPRERLAQLPRAQVPRSPIGARDSKRRGAQPVEIRGECRFDDLALLLAHQRGEIHRMAGEIRIGRRERVGPPIVHPQAGSPWPGNRSPPCRRSASPPAGARRSPVSSRRTTARAAAARAGARSSRADRASRPDDRCAIRRSGPARSCLDARVRRFEHPRDSRYGCPTSQLTSKKRR